MINKAPDFTIKEMTLEEWQELNKAVQGDAEIATTTVCISQQQRKVRINLNENVKFKLSERGKEIYRHRYDREPKLDDDGYMSMQLWMFMNTFGEHMVLGMHEVVQPLEIIYEESEDK